jgi:hypothetical protein
MDANGNPTPETTPGGDINAILGQLDPRLHGQFMKGVSDWNDMIGKRQERDLQIQKLQSEIKDHQEKKQQDDLNALAVGAHHVSQLFDTAQPNAALIGANGLYAAAKANGLADDSMDTFMSGANDAWQAAKGDPKREAAFMDAFKQQAGPILSGLIQRGDATTQDKLKPEKPVSLSEGAVLVDPVTGKKIAEGAPKPETRSPEVQRAEAIAQGNAPRAASLLTQIGQDAAARRDPNVAAARADAAAARETARNDTRADKSYQFNSAELERTAKPLTDQAERFGRLVTTINQKTPQADALVAPELLTVMAGGSGSGLRMNEAEISRVLGGRTNLEGVKAALNKWQLDPSKGLSITDAQRSQIQALIGDMHDRISKKAAALDEARTALYNTDDPTKHREIMANLKRTLADPGETGGPKKVTSKADFDALPSGTEFIDPTGQKRRKP